MTCKGMQSVEKEREGGLSLPVVSNIRVPNDAIESLNRRAIRGPFALTLLIVKPSTSTNLPLHCCSY